MQLGRHEQFLLRMSMTFLRFIVLALAVTVFVLVAHDYLSLGKAIVCFTVPFVAGYISHR